MNYKLGRRQPKRAPALKFSQLLTGIIPDHPGAVDHFAKVTDWGLYANDQYGDCGPVSVANSRKLITAYLGNQEESPSQDDVFDLYRRSGNPNFNPATGDGDNGVDMQTMLEACQSGGIGGKKLVAFASVDYTNVEEMKAATALFGVILLGVNLQYAQQSQTDAGLWDYHPSMPWGGHAIPAGLYTGANGLLADMKVISWAKVVGTTDRFISHQLGEAWVPIWQENLTTKQFLEGIDLGKLADAYLALTGKVLPIQPLPIPPSPSPTPVPVPSWLSDLVKQAFETLIAKFAGRVIIVNLLRLAEAYILQWLANNPAFVSRFAVGSQAAAFDPKTVLDEICTILESIAPEPWRSIIARVHGWIDVIFA